MKEPNYYIRFQSIDGLSLLYFHGKEVPPQRLYRTCLWPMPFNVLKEYSPMHEVMSKRSYERWAVEDRKSEHRIVILYKEVRGE